MGRFRFDREIIRRVIDNLLDNAAKHSPRNGKILVRTIPGKDFVTVSVTDQGEGIAPGDTEVIFEKFAQVGLSKKGTIHGTGLGLTFCKLAIEESGGRIWVESAPGKGASFLFTLPRR
jgi:signal transduction histidine kinase